MAPATLAPATLTPADAKRLIADGATLVDIRDPDEHARARIPGAINLPLAAIEALPPAAGPIIFPCRTGMRTVNAARLAAASGDAPCYILDGGIDAWRVAGHFRHVGVRRCRADDGRRDRLVRDGDAAALAAMESPGTAGLRPT